MAIAAGYSWRAQDPRVRWRSYLATVLVQVLVIAALLWFCFETPLPLPGEEGITVSFGTENSGRNAETPAYIPPATQRVTPAQVEERDESLTQDFEDAPEVRGKTPPAPPKTTSKSLLNSWKNEFVLSVMQAPFYSVFSSGFGCCD